MVEGMSLHCMESGLANGVRVGLVGLVTDEVELG
jgi:hypothetical protein